MRVVKRTLKYTTKIRIGIRNVIYLNHLSRGAWRPYVAMSLANTLKSAEIVVSSYYNDAVSASR